MPRDLETIVHKAIDRDPAQRYATAGELADGPAAVPRRPADPGAAIVAAGAAWRWCRRNKLVASLGAALALMLVVVSVGSVLAAAHSSRLARNATEAAASERRSRLEAEALRKQSDANFRGHTPRSMRHSRRSARAISSRFRGSSRSDASCFSPPSASTRSSSRSVLTTRNSGPNWRPPTCAIGQINADLGREAESRQALLSAISTYDAERRQYPGNIEIEDRLGDAWATLGDLDFEIGKRRNSPIEQLRKERMFKSYQQAVTLREAVARRQPESLLYAKKLATAVNRLGFAQSWLGLTQANLESQRRCAAIRFDLARRAPKTPRSSTDSASR